MPTIRLSRARKAAEALLTDRCRISDPSAGRPTLNRSTMVATVEAGPVVYEGCCQVSYGPGRSYLNSPEARAIIDHPVLSVPWDVEGLAVGQRVVIVEAAVTDLEFSDGDWVVDRVDASTHSLLRTAYLARTASRGPDGGNGS